MKFSKSRKTTSDKSGKSVWSRVLTIALAFVAILYFYPHPDKSGVYKYQVGEPWAHPDLVSRVDFSVAPDSDMVKALTDSARQNAILYYKRVALSPQKVKDNVLSRIDSVLAKDAVSSMSIIDSYTAGASQLTFKSSARAIIDKMYSNYVFGDNDSDIPKNYMVQEGSDSLSHGVAHSVKAIEAELNSQLHTQMPFTKIDDIRLDDLILPNVEYDDVKTDEQIKTAVAIALDANTRKVTPSEVIIHENETVTKENGRIIDMYAKELIDRGMGGERSELLTWLGQILYILLFFGGLLVYIALYEKRVWRSARSLGFIVGLVTLFVVLASVLNGMLSLGLYVVPLVIVPILVLVFFNARLALWTGVMTAMLYAAMSNNGYEYMTLQICAIAAAVFSLRDLTKRSQLLLTSALVGVAYIVSYAAFEWLARGSFDGMLWRMVAVLCVNAAFTSMAYVFMFPVERLFGFISNVTLVELTDVNAPLLRALCDECPGTFNHVVAVSNLASDAARQIGANELLARAGAMYHDIGKLSNPMFFTENQHGVNPHDGLSPLQSAQIIINHVTDGLRRAEKAGLPPVIRDFIAEHHGAGQAKYFYFTYCKQHPDEDVDPAPFTYPGPNPRTRETSVLMMADAVEAASRSLKVYDQKSITDLVNKIIDGQIADGLHNDSPLSFHDIKTIKQVFIRRMMTMYHSRIAYPDDPNKPHVGAGSQQPS